MRPIKLSEYIVEIQSLPDGFEGFKILHLSDIHLGRRNDRAEEILERVSSLKADAVVLTGDIVHAKRPTELGTHFLKQLTNVITPQDGFFGVWGNHDKHADTTQWENLSIHWLANSAKEIRRGNQSLTLAGVDQKSIFETDMIETLKWIYHSGPKILLAHYPSTIYLMNGVFDLVLSGHTHGGQISLPNHPIVTGDKVSRKYAVGKNIVGTTTLIVNQGTGFSGFLPMRLFAPAEIVSIRLKASG